VIFDGLRAFQLPATDSLPKAEPRDGLSHRRTQTPLLSDSQRRKFYPCHFDCCRPPKREIRVWPPDAAIQRALASCCADSRAPRSEFAALKTVQIREAFA